MKKSTYLITAMLAAALVMTACGSSTSTDTADDTEAVVTEETAGETEAEETEEDIIITAEDVLAPLSYDVTEYVTLCDYMNMDIYVGSDYAVTDEDVEEMVEAFASMYDSYYVVSDKTTVEDGDRVNIDYVGYLDGEAFDGGTAEDQDLVIGSGTYIDGFESSLIGAGLGETEITVTFPEDYGVDSLNGQEATFAVTINSISEPVEITYDTINDDWANDNFSDEEVTTVDELRDYIREYLESSNESSLDSEIQSQAIEKILEESEITIPDGYLDLRIEDYKEAVYATVEASGESFEDCMGCTEEEFLEQLPDSMETRVKKDMIFEAIVADMDYSFTQSDFDDYVMSYMYYYSFDSDEALFEQMSMMSELDGEDYMKLGYAEHMTWTQVQNSVNVITEDAE